MKVIVIYKKFHDIERTEIMPKVFYINENETPEDALRRIWEDHYNSLMAEQLLDETDPLDEDGCWYEEDHAMITWADGDTKEFYVVDVDNMRCDEKGGKI